MEFQSPPPGRGATATTRNAKSQFQSMHPDGVRRASRPKPCPHDVSTHVPGRGCDGGGGIYLLGHGNVSTHAPRMGRDQLQ